MTRHYCKNCGKKRDEKFMVQLEWMNFTAWVCIVHCSRRSVRIIKKGDNQ